MQPLSLIGTTFDDRYEVISSIGEGGMGQVYKAREIQLDRIVAIKVLHPFTAEEPQSALRFEREARVMANLSHANIVGFLRFGIWQKQPYIVMEYISGATLKDLLRQSKMSWQQALTIGIQICDAVSAAHEHGIIHRDLKPSNVVISQVAGQTLVKVMDFGLAGLLAHCQVPAQKLTQTGNLLGSLHYLSPEQASGTKVDARADIYALGCIIYECIVGKVPFDADDPMGVIYQHAKDRAPALSEVCPDSTRPQSLEHVLDRAMAKDPMQRYQSMAELRDDLESILSDRAAGGASEAARRANPLQRKRIRARLILVPIALSVIALSAYVAGPPCLRWILLSPPASSWIDRGLSWSNKLATIGAVDMAAYVLQTMAQIAGERHAPLAQAHVIAKLSLLTGARDPAESAQLAAQALRILTIYTKSEPAGVSEAELTTASAVAQAVQPHSGKSTFENVETLSSLSERYATTKSLYLAFAEITSALAERIYAHSDVRRALEQTRLADALLTNGDTDASIAHLKLALLDRPKIRPLKEQLTLDLCLLQGWMTLRKTDMASACAEHLVTLAPQEGLPEIVRAPAANAFDLIKANPTLEKSIFDKPKTFQQSPGLVSQYASHLSYNGQERKALVLYNKLIDNSETPDQLRADAAVALSRCFLELKDWRAALKSADLSIELCHRHPPDADGLYVIFGRATGIGVDTHVQALVRKATALTKLKQLVQAQAVYDQALALSSSASPLMRKLVYTAMFSAYCGGNRPDETERVARAALVEAKINHAAPEALSDSYDNLITALLIQGKKEEAESLWDQCKPLLTRLSPLQQWNRTWRWYLRQQCMRDSAGAKQAALDSLRIATDNHLNESRMWQSLGAVHCIYLKEHKFQECKANLERIYRECKNLLRTPESQLAALKLRRAILTYAHDQDPANWRQYRASCEQILKAQKLLTKRIGDYALVTTELSIAEDQLGHSREAASLRRQCLDMSAGSPTLRHGVLLTLLAYYRATGKLQSAEQLARQCVAQAKRDHLSPAVITQSTLHLADTLTLCHQADKATAVLKDLAHDQAAYLAADGPIRIEIEQLIQTLSATTKN